MATFRLSDLRRRLDQVALLDRKIYPAAVEFGDYDWRMEDFRFANFCAVSRERVDIKRLLES
jgi:hypothetical protein